MAARLISEVSIQSFVQQGRRFRLSDIAEELRGEFDVSEEAEISGGYADIYRGTWTTPQGERIEVAIKEFKKLTRKNKHDDENALVERVKTRVKREAFIWSRTKHPYLHPFLGYRSQPRPRLISPWYRHGNLLDYLRANPRLPRLDKMILIRQAACGLEHLHSQKPPICHGDIKPENVLINDQLEAVISDFGLGRVLLGLGIHTGFTTSETAHGTLRYMAAELFTEGNPRTTLQTDVYAFGGLILAVLSGKPPFFDLKPLEVIAWVMQGRQPRAADHPELPSPDPLWNLIRRCWDKNPDARSSMKKVLEELREYIDKELPRQPEVSTSYSHIYRGIWTSLNGEQVEVAIKELKVLVPGRQGTNIEALSLKLDAHMKREVSLWRQARHPNLQPFLGYRLGSQPILISPWWGKGNLLDYLGRNPSLSRLEKLKLICQAARGLDYLHSLAHPICHGDVRPENVLINDRFEAVLSDFDLHRVLTDLGIPDGSSTSMEIKERLPYFAAEILRGEARTRETDVYAFAGVILTAMSGKRPFGGLDEPIILLSILQGEKPRAEDHPELPASDLLWSLMRRCWRMNRIARPAMQAVVAKLEECMHGEHFGPFSTRTRSPAFNDKNDDASGINFAIASSIGPAAGQISALGSDSAPEPLPGVADVENMVDGSCKEYAATWKVFKRLEVESKDIIPVEGYINAVVDIGLTLLEIAQAVKSNKDMSASLCFSAMKLADLLDSMKELSASRRIDEAIFRITDIQNELQCVDQKLWKWCFSGRLMTVMSSQGNQEFQGGEEMVQDALRKVQLLAGSDNTGLVTGLWNLG